VSVDTACASSATALNLACTSIWSNECDTAIVGGMMLLNSPDMYAGLSRGHFVSSDGPCKTFDDEANGYCRGEAVASVVLKRLDAATADNDNILGVILASATNYSAYAASITQPHAGAQETLFRKVLSQAAVQPDEIDYVELHGTGTQLGDAIEMASVLNVLAPESPARAAEKPLYVGSIKANIGHGESASGISALIKTLLLFQKEQIPPHIGIKSGRLNRTFPSLEKRRVRIADRLTPFPAISGRRRKALINNFGAAGGNSSFILAEGNSVSESPKSTLQRDHVISVTAKSDASLQGNLRNVIDYLEKYPDTAIEDLAYTTTARKVQHPLRVSFTASTASQATKALSAALQRPVTRPASKTQDVIFAFTGQGSLLSGVAKQLLETNSSFRSHLTRFERIAVDQGFPLYVQDVINGTDAFDQLSTTQTQLCHVSIQMALFKLWSSWNIKPHAVIGHSLGEYAAFFAAGVLSASDTLYLVGRRATLLQTKCTSSTHSMLAVNLPMGGIQGILRDRLNDLEASCLNGPSDVVISGPAASIREAEAILKASGTSCTMLNCPYAFHSSQIDPILAPFDHELISVPFSTPRIPILSTLLGRTLQVGDEIGPSYFMRHAREPVQFLDALRTAQEEGIVTPNSAFLELGPHPVCLGMIRSTLGPIERLLPSLHRKEPSLTTICRSLAALNDQGFSIDWNEYHNSFDSTPKLLNLPTYAFDEKRYWIEYQNNWLLQRHGAATSSPDKPIPKLTTTVQRVVSSAVQGTHATVAFESDLSDPYLHKLIAGHVLNGVALCPSVSDECLHISSRSLHTKAHN
jgi:acyl transferase domain-containing protein